MTMPATACQKRHAVDGDGEHADEDRRELQVGRRPRPEQLTRLAVSVGLGDELVSARFDGDDAVAVGAVGGGFGRCHGYTVVCGARGRNRKRRLAVARRPRERVEDTESGQRAQRDREDRGHRGAERVDRRGTTGGGFAQRDEAQRAWHQGPERRQHHHDRRRRALDARGQHGERHDEEAADRPAVRGGQGQPTDLLADERDTDGARSTRTATPSARTGTRRGPRRPTTIATYSAQSPIRARRRLRAGTRPAKCMPERRRRTPGASTASRRR